MQYQIRWHAKPKGQSHWEASTDEGRTWERLRSDNEEDSSEAIDEAAVRFGIVSSKWDLIDV